MYALRFKGLDYLQQVMTIEAFHHFPLAPFSDIHVMTTDNNIKHKKHFGGLSVVNVQNIFTEMVTRFMMIRKRSFVLVVRMFLSNKLPARRIANHRSSLLKTDSKRSMCWAAVHVSFTVFVFPLILRFCNRFIPFLTFDKSKLQWLDFVRHHVPRVRRVFY